MGRMSFMMSAPAGARGEGMPQGELLATYSTYAQAREAVSTLVTAEDFPATAVSIVGKDLRVVERVRGRLGYPQVALGAAFRGLFFGAMLGGFMLLINPALGWQQVLVSAALGVGVWMIFGVIAFAARKGQTSGQTSVASTQQLVPVSYDVVVAFDHAFRARQLLRLGGAGADPGTAPGGSTASTQPGPAAASSTARTGGSGPAPASDVPGDSAPAGQRGSEPPKGLDRSYGQRLSDDEVARLIEARGGAAPSPRSDGAAADGAPAEHDGHRGR